MADSNPSVRAAVEFSQHVTNLFHIWAGLGIKNEDRLVGVIFFMETCSTTLRTLEEYIVEDQSKPFGIVRIFKPAALEDIESLAAKCSLLCRFTILLIKQAANEEGFKGITDVESGLETGPLPDLLAMKTLGLITKLKGKWDWLEPRLDLCRDQLRWVGNGLLIHLQIAKLAKMKMTIQMPCPSDQPSEAFDQEFIARSSIQLLLKAQAKCAKNESRDQERAKRLRDLRKKQAEDDTSSVKSSSVASSAGTIVNENGPTVNNTAEKNGEVDLKTPAVHPVPVEVVVIETAPKDDLAAGKVDTQTTKPDKPSNASDPTKGKDSTNIAAKVSSSLNDMSSNLSKTMSEWTHHIFGKDDEFKKDWESTELEAYVAFDTVQTVPVKVPFGHRRLKYGLKKVMDGKNNQAGTTTFDRYIDHGVRMQLTVDNVVREANLMKRRERVCLAFQEYKKAEPGRVPFVIVFFSIQREKAPVVFTDCMGRKFTIPYQFCKTWDGMKSTINEAFRNIPEIGAHVIEGHYDLINSASGEVILMSLWDSNIKPGDRIGMTLWPPENHPLKFINPSYLPYVPPGAPSRISAERGTRYQRMIQVDRYEANRSQWPTPMPMPMRPMGPNGPPRRVMPRPPPPPPSSTSTTVSRREEVVTEGEMNYLMRVNFSEELEKVKSTTLTDLLTKYTNMTDVSGEFLTILENLGDSDFDADYGSDTSSEIDD